MAENVSSYHPIRHRPDFSQQQADEDQDLLDNLDAMVEEEAVDHAEEVQQEEEIAQQEQEEGGEMEAQGEEMDQIEQQEEIQAAAEDAAQEPREMTEEEKMILEEINTVKVSHKGRHDARGLIEPYCRRRYRSWKKSTGRKRKIRTGNISSDIFTPPDFPTERQILCSSKDLQQYSS
eukprot:767398-Hanusia_phi.AAC.2